MDYECRPWKHPDNYMGEIWPDFYSSGFGRSRDSDTLEESNFQVVWDTLKDSQTETDGEPDIRIVRESHWAVGWAEWIAIHSSNIMAIMQAQMLCEKANNYPVLDEDHWSDLEWHKASDYWDSMSVKERLYWLDRYTNAPCFAARHQLDEICNRYETGDLISQLAG